MSSKTLRPSESPNTLQIHSGDDIGTSRKNYFLFVVPIKWRQYRVDMHCRVGPVHPGLWPTEFAVFIFSFLLCWSV